MKRRQKMEEEEEHQDLDDPNGRRRFSGRGHGLGGMDYPGGPATDPTENVKALSLAANKRQDDLRDAAKELSDTKILHQRELMDVRAKNLEEIGKIRERHQRELDVKESSRLDSIRAVDREEVAKTAAAAQTAITTLANTTNQMAETLRNQVANTAAAAENRQVSFATDMNKRLSAVELSLSEGKGKQQVADPQIERMATMVEKLVQAQATGGGQKQGVASSWGVLLGIVGLVASLIAIFVFLARPAQQPPSVIYVPSPAGTMLPTVPPATAPR
jgi:hypothetical protein